MAATEFDNVIYECEPPVARIVLNRPDRANTQSSGLVHDIDRCLDMANQDYDVKVLIIKANGKGFCAGHDIAPGFENLPEFSEALERQGGVWKAHTDLFLWPTVRLWEFPKPTIAQVHGYAIGGGTFYAFIPDITVASDDAYFQNPLVQGFAFPGGETMIEPWVFMNWKRASEYLYTAQTLSATEAHDLGLVNRVVPRADLDAEVEALAAQIARAPLSTLMATKALIRRAWEQMGLRLHWQMSNDLMAVVEHLSDAQQARQAIIEGKYPRQVAEEP